MILISLYIEGDILTNMSVFTGWKMGGRRLGEVGARISIKIQWIHRSDNDSPERNNQSDQNLDSYQPGINEEERSKKLVTNEKVCLESFVKD